MNAGPTCGDDGQIDAGPEHAKGSKRTSLTSGMVKMMALSTYELEEIQALIHTIIEAQRHLMTADDITLTRDAMHDAFYLRWPALTDIQVFDRQDNLIGLIVHEDDTTIPQEEKQTEFDDDSTMYYKFIPVESIAHISNPTDTN